MLFQCASTGIVSIGMTKFIKEDMHNVKSIQQFKEQFLLQFNSLIVLVTQQFIAIIEKLAYYSQKLE